MNLKKKVKVSIICITYNHESFIEDALKGFLMQDTDFEYEILINDDASKDRTPNILREYEKRYPKIFKILYQKENLYSKGISPSSILYEMAQGDYLALCEGDDYWIDKFKLQKQIDFLEKNKDYIGTGHNVYVVNKHKEKFKKFQEIWPIYQAHTLTKYEELEEHKICAQTASLVIRNFWKNLNIKKKNIYSSKKINGDTKLTLYMIHMGKIFYFSDIMSCYRLTFDTDSWTSLNKNNYSIKREYEYRNESIAFVKDLLNQELRYREDVFYFNILKKFIRLTNFENFINFIFILKKDEKKIKNIISVLFFTIKKVMIKLKLKKKTYLWPLLMEE